MKKILLIIAIAAIVACVLAVLFALLNMHAYYNLLDGTPEHYKWLHNRMIVSFVSGIILSIIGIACLIIRSKI